jgi:hypothetical protein
MILFDCASLQTAIKLCSDLNLIRRKLGTKPAIFHRFLTFLPGILRLENIATSKIKLIFSFYFLKICQPSG